MAIGILKTNLGTTRDRARMKGFFEQLQWKMAGWMQGRHGVDGLSNFLMVAGFVFIVLSVIPGLDFFSWLALVLLMLSLLRSFSKNELKRSEENERYTRFIAKPKSTVSLASKRWKNRKTTTYFKCSCGKILSVPRGKGKIRVTCPNCHTLTERKS